MDEISSSVDEDLWSTDEELWSSGRVVTDNLFKYLSQVDGHMKTHTVVACD